MKNDINPGLELFSADQIAAVTFSIEVTLAAFRVFNLPPSELRAIAINALVAAKPYN